MQYTKSIAAFKFYSIADRDAHYTLYVSKLIFIELALYKT